MSTKNTPNQAPLDDTLLGLIGASMAPMRLPADRMQPLRERVMARIAKEGGAKPVFNTIRADEGQWVQIAPKIEKKTLHVDHVNGIEAYLLRAEPGAEAPGHVHEADELCLVLEGEVSFDDIHLKAGDYHFAPKGSRHGTARSKTGALIYLQGAIL
ncbi:MAG: cupin domain-containing protein [Pseudomonadota bacterium]